MGDHPTWRRRDRSVRARWRTGPVALLLALGAAGDAPAAAPDTTTLLSRPDGTAAVPAPGTGPSALVTTSLGGAGSAENTSDNGRYVVFVSDAPDLSGDNDDTVSACYVRDTVGNTTILVSRATGASGAAADQDCEQPAISGDGRTVAFRTTAKLDPVADTDAVHSIYLRDLQSDTTTLVSAEDGGSSSVVANPGVSIDQDGSHVAFTTLEAAAAGDTDSLNDVYVREIATETTELAVASTSASENPSLSDDGRTVAYLTDAALDGAHDTNGVRDVYVTDLDGASTVLASRATGATGNAGSTQALSPRLSGDGSVVAFTATDALDPIDTNAQMDVYVRDLVGNVTERVSVADDETQFPFNASARSPAISDDGSRVAFVGGSPGYVELRDRSAGTTAIVGKADGPTGTELITGNADVSIGGNGRSVTFALNDADASDEDDDGFVHVYQRRVSDHPLAPDTTVLVDRPNGTAPFTGPASQLAEVTVRDRALSWDGRFSVFHTDSDLVPGAVDQVNVFRRDSVSGETVQVNLSGSGDPGSSVALDATISARGDKVAFRSSATNLHPDATTGGVRAYVRDLGTGETLLVSRADGPTGTPLTADEVEISPDGTRVAFVTASALGDDANAAQDVFVRDLLTAATIPVSVTASGATGSGASREPSFDWDGSTVAFRTAATDLTDVPDANGQDDVVVRDLDTGTTTLASRANGVSGAIGDDQSRSPSLDGDGNRVAFVTRASNLQNTTANDVVVRDLAAGTTTNLTPTGNSSERPSISDDGAFVALETTGVLQGPTDDNVTVDAYRVAVAGLGATLLSRATGATGAVGDLESRSDTINGAGGPALAGSGACAAFGSLASNLDPDWGGTTIRQAFLRNVGACQGVDTTGPTTMLNAGPTGGVTTADSTPTFVMGANERATFICSVDGGAPAPCRTPLTTAALGDGAHTFSFQATDPVGNIGTTVNASFVVDTTGPTTTITAGPTGGAAATANPQSFSFTADESSTFSCRVDGAAFASCTSPHTTGTLATGTHIFEVRGTDGVGNEGPVATATFVVPAPPAPPALPAAVPTPTPTPTVVTAAPTAKEPAKIRVLRAGIADGKLDMLLETTSRATGKLEVEYESSGLKHRFDVSLSKARSARGPKARAAESRIKVLEQLPSAQRRKATGIVTITYAGNATVRPDEVRLRAATNKALLTRGTTKIDSSGRLVVDGTISTRAVGVVRVRLGYVAAAGQVAFKTYNAKITTKKGASRKVWSVSEKLPTDAAKSGGQLSIQFTGYEPRLIRGEQTAKQVDPA